MSNRSTISFFTCDWLCEKNVFSYLVIFVILIKAFQNGHRTTFIINTNNYFASRQDGLIRNVIVNNSHQIRKERKIRLQIGQK